MSSFLKTLQSFNGLVFMNIFKQSVMAIMLIYCCNTGMAAEFKQSVGAGLQYGGVIGWQGALLNSNNSKFKLGFGYTGTSFGYERFILPNVSLGGQLFGNQYIAGGAISANYYLSSGTTKGWVFGIDFFRAYNSGEQALDSIIRYFEFVFDTDLVDYDARLKNGISISIGYQF
jgi:hypothetical protein